MKPKICLIFLLLCSLYSCKHKQMSENNFDDKIILIENNPQLYLSKLDTTKQNHINNSREATDFLLSALTLNYINNDCYPQKELLLKRLNSNHREVNRQYYPTEQLRQSNAIKKNDSTHKA